MAKRRKPKVPLQPLLIVDDRGRPEEKWIPASQLPAQDRYGWSESVLVCQFIPGDLRPTLIKAAYVFRRQQWMTAMGEVEHVTHWQRLPEFPREYRV